MTPVVIDASAGVELIADTTRGRALRALLPPDPVPGHPRRSTSRSGPSLGPERGPHPRPDQRSSPATRRVASASGAGALPVRRRVAAPAQHHFRRCHLCRARRAPRGSSPHRRSPAGQRADPSGARAASAVGGRSANPESDAGVPGRARSVVDALDTSSRRRPRQESPAGFSRDRSSGRETGQRLHSR